MYNKSDLLNDIIDLGIDPKSTVMIHSSMKAIGEVDGGADTVLDAWMEYMKDGLLVFVTHTWMAVPEEKKVFDVRNEPSNVGILGNLFRKRGGVIRSLHPTHSVAAFGKDAEAYVSGEENRGTPCARDGCYGKLIDRNAQIIFIGCELDKNTFIHGVEEWNDIPGRLSKDPMALKIIDYSGNELDYTRYGHECHACEDISDNYIKLEKPFAALGAIHYGKFGDAKTIVGDAAKMDKITSDFLKINQDLFVDSNSVPEEWYK